MPRLVSLTPDASRQLPSAPAPNFDRVARWYRWAEYLALGPLLQRIRTCFLPRLSACRVALLLGDGDGRFAAALLRHNPQIQALAIDESAVMLSLLGKRCRGLGKAGCLELQQLSVLHAQPWPDTDLVVTHFLLDCLFQLEVEALAQRLAAKLRPGSLWLVSDFRYPSHGLIRTCGRVYIRLLYLAFRLLTGLRPQHLPDPQTALRRAGFHLLARKLYCFGLLYTELWQRG